MRRHNGKFGFEASCPMLLPSVMSISTPRCAASSTRLASRCRCFSRNTWQTSGLLAKSGKNSAALRFAAATKVTPWRGVLLGLFLYLLYAAAILVGLPGLLGGIS